MNFVGAGIPREAPDNFLCPVCGRNMSDQPIPPVTGLQVFGKYLAAILAGLVLMAVAMVGSYLGDRLDTACGTFRLLADSCFRVRKTQTML